MTILVYEYRRYNLLQQASRRILYAIVFLCSHTHDLFFFVFQALGSKSSDASANNCFNRWKLCNRGKSIAYLNITITFESIRYFGTHIIEEYT